MNRFFVSTPLDFEQTTLQELKEVWPYLLGKDAKPQALALPEVKVMPGGLEFETDLFTAVQLNFFLKTAHRILLRMTSFKTRDLPKFYQNFKRLPWLEYLPNGTVEWEVAAQKSRLNNEKRLQESASKALQEIFGSKCATEPCATIYIRMEDDLCTISLDMTGEHLHKRGWSVLKGQAPLRETIAAFTLKALQGSTPRAALNKVTLLDPMMGSGTFLCEARTLHAGQFARKFAFQQWKNTPKLFLSPSFALNYTLPPQDFFKKYVGCDLDVEMLVATEKNFAEAERQVEIVQKKSFKKATLELHQQDSLVQKCPAEEPLWMILNPPYGERLEGEHHEGPQGLARDLCRLYQPERLGILYPEKERVLRAPGGYKVVQEIKINNGGIRCLFTILTRL